jgi:hypothetical protein
MHPTHSTQYRQIQTARCGPASKFVLTACLLMAAEFAQAHTFCADSSAAIQAALTAASDGGANDNENNTIQIVIGTYYTANNGNAEFSYNNQTTSRKLDINGGYNSDCSIITENPELTILDGGGATRVFESESNGDVSLRYLTFQNGSAVANQYGAGVALNLYDTAVGPIIFDQNIVRKNHSASFGGGFRIGLHGSGTTLQFENNLIVGNTADNDIGGGEIDDDVTTANIVNNTFAQNTVANSPVSAIGGLSCLGSGAITMSNNIFWGNSGYDLNTAAILVDNDYGRGSVSPNGSSSGNVSVDPQFSSSTDFHLLPTSPLLGLGTLTPTGGLPTIDIEGHPRSYDNLVDLGAYERGDMIFADGFED